MMIHHNIACATQSGLMCADSSSCPQGTEVHGWNVQPAPLLAINYWQMEPTATMRDVVLVIRADEVRACCFSVWCGLNRCWIPQPHQMEFGPMRVVPWPKEGIRARQIRVVGCERRIWSGREEWVAAVGMDPPRGAWVRSPPFVTACRL